MIPPSMTIPSLTSTCIEARPAKRSRSRSARRVQRVPGRRNRRRRRHQVVGRDDDSARADRRPRPVLGRGERGLTRSRSTPCRPARRVAYTVVVERVGTVASAARTIPPEPRGPARPETPRRVHRQVDARRLREPTLYGEALAAVREFVSSGGFLERPRKRSTRRTRSRGMCLSRSPSASTPRDAAASVPYANAFYNAEEGRGLVLLRAH